MITEEQYQKAKSLVDQYEEQRSKELVENLRCIGCKKPVEPMDGLLAAPTELERSAWDGGTVALVRFGYGSRLHDGDAYYVALCDGCMLAAAGQGIIIQSSSTTLL